MIRPRLRSTVSRRNKYLSIAPRAEKKLYRESRRGSHDLRRLVGHANFLDLLVDSLDPQSDDEVDETPPLPTQVKSNNNEPTEASHELSDDDSTASEEDWSDSHDDDDDDHALVRTASRTSLVELAVAAREEIEASIVESGDDYFSRPGQPQPVIAVTEDYKTAGVTVDEVTSSLSDLMEELGYGRSTVAVVNEERAGDVDAGVDVASG